MKQKFRITRSFDFRRVRRLGKSFTHPLVILTVLQGEGECSRAGFISGKCVGNAVKRNRAKRQLRAILFGFFPYFVKCVDILLIAREPIAIADFSKIEAAVKQLLVKAEMIDADIYDAGRPTS